MERNVDGNLFIYTKACWIESDDDDALDAFKKRKHQFMALDREGQGCIFSRLELCASNGTK